LAQKSYKKKIHNSITVYQANKLPTGMKMSRIMKIIEKKIPSYFLSEIESLIIADISKITEDEHLLEGNTIFISNEHYCEDLLIENFIIAAGESLFDKYEHLIYDKELEKEFLEKRRDLYYDLVKIYKKIALSDFLILEMSGEFTKSMKKIDFNDVIYNTQKYFINYDSCLSIKNYFSHLFNSYLEKNIEKKKFQGFMEIINKVRKTCKENTNYEQNN
jgi:hypothetical protein